MTAEIYHGRALVGKAGEALVAGELLRKQIDVAYPATTVALTYWHIGNIDLARLYPFR